MVDIDTQMKIDELVDYAYDTTIERIIAIENADIGLIYQTILMEKGNYRSFLEAYSNYYCGVLEGILFTRFLEELNRMPTPSENSFIAETIAQRFEKFKDIIINLAEKKFKEID